MKILKLIQSVAKAAFISSASPDFFGARRSRKLEDAFQKDWKATQDSIDSLNTMNPFQGAAAKSAMTKASQNAKEMQNKILNTMGAAASPEAIIASAGEVNKGVGAAAGEIAAGAEANKNAQLNALKGLKTQQMGMHSQQITNTAQANAQSIEAFARLLEGAGGVAGAFMGVPKV